MIKWKVSMLLRKPGIVISLTLVLTAICLIESANMVPWSPYFILFAVLSVAISLLFDSTPVRPTRMHGSRLWQFMLMIVIVCCIIDAGIFTIGWDWFLARIGLGKASFYSITGALNDVIVSGAKNRHLTLVQAQTIFGIFMLLWAPIGEELFYRGYVYNSLKEHYSMRTALLISCFLFGLRHTTHFFYLWTTISVAGLMWAVDVFIIGALFTYVYERTGGLMPVMIVHFLVNLLSLILTA